MTPNDLQIRGRLGADLSLQSATSRVSGGTLTPSGEVWNDCLSARGPNYGDRAAARCLWGAADLNLGLDRPRWSPTGRGRAAFRLLCTLLSGFKSARYTFTASAAATPVTLTTTGLTTTSASNRWRISRARRGNSSKAVHTMFLGRDGPAPTVCGALVVDVTTATLGKQRTLAAGASTTFDAWSPWAGPCCCTASGVDPRLGVAD